MQSFLQLFHRIRSWRPWLALRRHASALPSVPDRPVDARSVFREVTTHGVRVYSLCGSCGAHLTASATLCDACARDRAVRRS